MTQFLIRYGVGGGYNDITEKVIEANSEEEANQTAYELAQEVFESYSIYDNELEDGEEGSLEEWLECFESWAVYNAVAV